MSVGDSVVVIASHRCPVCASVVKLDGIGQIFIISADPKSEPQMSQTLSLLEVEVMHSLSSPLQPLIQVLCRQQA